MLVHRIPRRLKPAFHHLLQIVLVKVLHSLHHIVAVA